MLGFKTDMKHHKKWKIRILAMLLLPFCLAARGQSEMLLPDQLTEIGNEAFAGDSSITDAIIPDSVRSIGEKAFWGCSNLARITIHGNVADMGDMALAGCTEDLLICTEPGSAALAFAQANSIDYQAATTYRALLIAQTYLQDSALTLEGPENDVAALKACLEAFSETPYRVSVKKELAAQGILDAIGDAFDQAGSEDVSLLYYSGHGVLSEDSQTQGALLGADGSDFVTAVQLRKALDRIPGRKIVIIDACYSGNFLSANSALRSNDATDTTQPPESLELFSDSFIQAFSARKRGGLASDGYYVLTAASADEESYEADTDGSVMGLFTAGLVKGCGWNSDVLPADGNSNGVITLQEAYQYAANTVNTQWQHAQVYPASCTWFGILRQ